MSNFDRALPYEVGILADTAYPYLYGFPCTQQTHLLRRRMRVLLA